MPHMSYELCSSLGRVLGCLYAVRTVLLHRRFEIYSTRAFLTTDRSETLSKSGVRNFLAPNKSAGLGED